MPDRPPAALIAVVILNWNKAAMTANCVEAVARLDYRPVLVVVVDNGSAPGSLGPLEGLGLPFELIRNPRNLGFTGGVNIGIRRALAAGAEYVWLLNNDALPAPDSLSTLVAGMLADPGIGMASPAIRNSDAPGEIDFHGGLWDGRATITTADPAAYRRGVRDTPERIWLVGTALLIRRAVIERIGLFDDRFFAYWEDTDYSLRAIAAGWRNVVVEGAGVARPCAGALAQDRHSKPLHLYYYMARNELLFLRKHLGWWRGRRSLWWALRRQLRLLSGASDPAQADAIRAGIADGLGWRRGPYEPGRRVPAALGRLLGAAISRARD